MLVNVNLCLQGFDFFTVAILFECTFLNGRLTVVNLIVLILFMLLKWFVLKKW